MGYIGGNAMTEYEKALCPACARKTVRDEAQKKKLLNRLSRIEGQVRGVKKMIENDAYCNDVLTQSAAIAAAANIPSAAARHSNSTKNRFFIYLSPSINAPPGQYLPRRSTAR